jgi:transposase
MVSLILPEASTGMMNLFLEQVSQTFSTHFIVMQVDGAGWHRATDLIIPENIRLIPQPAYSPELNPVEHIWDELREKYFYVDTFNLVFFHSHPFLRASRAGDAALAWGWSALRAESTGVLH